MSGGKPNRGRLLGPGSPFPKSDGLWDPLSGDPVGEPLIGPGWLTAVCAVPLSDGRTLLARAGQDGAVRLSDPLSGNLLGDPLTGHTDVVLAVCAAPLPEGKILIASAGADRAVFQADVRMLLLDELSAEGAAEQSAAFEGGHAIAVRWCVPSADPTSLQAPSTVHRTA